MSFNAFVIAFQDEDLSLSLRQLLASPRGRATVAAELLALVGGWLGGRVGVLCRWVGLLDKAKLFK